jgi:RimJ/RimL family protein N-acetyltransferase
MERACRLLLDWGFGAQGVRTVVWRAHVGNWASRRLAWRLGFSLDGTVREYLVHRGGLLVDAWTGTLLATDERRPRGVWLDAPLLSDGVVRLRAVRPTDGDRVVEAAGDDRTQRWLGRMPRPYTSVEAGTWLEQITEEAATGSTLTWAVTGEDDVLRGVVNLFDLEPGNAAEIGCWAHPAARGRGLTTRACVLALGHGFTAFDFLRVQGHAALGNTASRHVLEACGLREAGVARLGTFVRPEGRVDAMKYDLLVEEWRASRHSVAGVISG